MKRVPLLTEEITGTLPMTSAPRTAKYNVEYFHIYTDEHIETRHTEGLESLRAIEKSWSFAYDRIILIDNYNPLEHVTTAKDVIAYLEEQGMAPDFWANEGDMVPNAQRFLDSLADSKLKRSYQKYIAMHGKYPCSLLTATWYLTRLGHFDMSVIQSLSEETYTPAKRLFNLLPQDYEPVEQRANKLILSSPYAAEADKIQNLFYPVVAGRALDLF